MYLYIDPGTGSMLFTIAIGIVSVGVFFLRSLFLKLKFLFSNGKVDADKNSYKFAIFSDDKRYWNTFGPICDEFEKRGVEAVFFTASEDDPALKTEYKHVKCIFAGKGNATFSRMNLLKADVVLSTTPNLDVYQWKRSHDVKYYVHIFHAIGDPALYRMFSLDAYDAILNSGPVFEKQIRKLEEIRNEKPKEIVDGGLPYLDSLLARKNAGTRVVNEKPVVLLSPSWNSNAILSRYGEEFIEELISTGYHIIVRPHPQSFKSEKELMDRLMAKFPENENFEWNRDNDNYDVLNRSDIMISDYSGIIFDYSLIFNKPVIYAEFDFDDSQYDAHWLDEKLWMFETIKKIGKPFGANYKNTLKSLIDSSLNDEGRFEVYETARKEGWANIGESAKFTVDYLISKQQMIENEAQKNSAKATEKEKTSTTKVKKAKGKK